VFKAGLTHAKEVAAMKAARPESATSEAVAHEKERLERHGGGAYTAAELEVFKAGFEHYKNVVAPWEAAHPAHHHYTAEELAAYKAAHPERFESQPAHHHYTAEELAAYKAAHPERFESQPAHHHAAASGEPASYKTAALAALQF